MLVSAFLSVSLSAAAQAAPIAPSTAVTPEVITSARQTLDNEMTDWERSRFRNVTARRSASGKVIFCGEVNAMTPMGGMAGWKDFYLFPGFPMRPLIVGDTDRLCSGERIDQTDYAPALASNAT